MALHPTNEFGKDCVALKEGKKNRTYAYELAERGYVVLAPDAMTAGERIFKGTRCFCSAPFYQKYPDWSTAGKNIADHMQGVDLLATLEYVDDDAIAAIGHSFGGYNSFFLASMDNGSRRAAPRPFFINSAQSDHIFPHWESVAACILDVFRLYCQVSAEDNFKSVIIPGDHDFPPEIRTLSYEFLDSHCITNPD